jgi:integrase/recombinase XerD
MTKRAATLLPSQLRHLLRVTEATSRHPERDAVILWLGFGCGMRVTEIARLTIADVLLPSGRLRDEVSLRAEITKGCRQRLAYLTNPKLIAAMERYFEWRHAKGFGCAPDSRQYRGFWSHSRLILTWKGSAYELATKRRVSRAGEVVEYLAADSLQNYIKDLYRAAGLGAHASSHSGRRTFASRVIAAGESMETLSVLLGHAEIDVTASYVDVDARKLQEMFEVVV